MTQGNRRRSLLLTALLSTALLPAAAADSSVKDAAKQFGHAVASAGRAVGKAGGSAGRAVGRQVKHDAPPAARAVRDKNREFWRNRKADSKKLIGKLRGSTPGR